VTWLLRHDPVMRPRAAQLLTSPLLPSPEKQKEYYDTAIAGELVGGVTLLC
jgi:translation initiation factor 2-alpha kinase 4